MDHTRSAATIVVVQVIATVKATVQVMAAQGYCSRLLSRPLSKSCLLKATVKTTVKAEHEQERPTRRAVGVQELAGLGIEAAQEGGERTRWSGHPGSPVQDQGAV